MKTSKDVCSKQRPDSNAVEVLSNILPYNLLLQAFTEAELLASNSIIFDIATRHTGTQCPIDRLILYVRYDFVNEVIRRVVLELLISPEIEVGEMFGRIGHIIKRFNGDFELTKDYVRVCFSIQQSMLENVIHIVNLLKDLVCKDLNFIVERYEVLVEN